MEPITIIIGFVALLLGSVITFFIIKNLDLAKSKSLIKDAEKEAGRIKKEKILQAKEKFIELKSQHDKSINEKNQEFNKSQNRVKEKETKLNQRLGEMNRKEKDLTEEKSTLEKQKSIVAKKQEDLDSNKQKPNFFRKLFLTFVT